MVKSGRKNSLNKEIVNNYNQLNKFHQNAVLHSFESKDIEELININNKHAVRKFILQIILWLRKQEIE